MTGMGSVAGDFCSHIEMGSHKVYVICRVVKMRWRPALSPATLRLLPPVTWETHIPSDMCSPTWKTHIPSDMCSPPWKHISLVLCVPQPGKHISLVICVPQPRKHISLVICVPPPGKHISLVISDVFPYLENTYP